MRSDIDLYLHQPGEALKVLVVIPTHHRVAFVEEAIRSVESQTRRADQVIITGNVGPGLITDAPLDERLNTAIEDSGCDAFAMLSDDDTLEPDFLSKTLAEMESRQVDIVYTDCWLIGEKDGYGSSPGTWTRECIDRNTVPLCTSLCSRKAWERAGGYALVPFFDWDFWWRCFYTGASAHHLREPLWNYRIHPDQDSRKIDWDDYRKQLLKRHDELRLQLLAGAQ